MRLSQKKRRLLKQTAAALTCLLSSSAVATAEPMLPNFANEGKNIVNYPQPNQRFVVLPTGLANITAQRFQLPKDTLSYPIAGMTLFPYYEASPELKDFLNTTRINGVPITDFRATQNIPPWQLPATDLIRLNIPIPTKRPDKNSASRLAMKDNLKDEVPWMVAHQGGQSFGVPGDPQALVMVSSGTMFNAAAPRTMAVKCGIMWVLTGQRPVAVLTKYGAVEVKPYSIAAVEQTWFNRVKAASLYGNPVDVLLTHKGKASKVSVEKGKELAINESTVASAGSSDYVDTNKSTELIATKTLLAPSMPELDLQTRNFDPDISKFVSELKGVEPPIESMQMVSAYKKMFAEFGVTDDMRREALRKQILQKNVVATKPAAFKASLDDRYFVPVYKPVRARGPVIFPHVEAALKTLWVQNGVVKYLSNSNLEIENGTRVALTSGHAVISAKDPMSLRVNDCFINMQDGAVVEIVAKKDLVLLRNLRELGNKSVLLKTKARTIECAAGEELIVSDNVPAIFAEMKNDGVTRRNVHTLETAGGSLSINKSEIELTSLLQFDPMLRQIVESKDDFDRKLVSQIIKMDAVLSMVTKNHGSYQRMTGLPQASH